MTLETPADGATEGALTDAARPVPLGDPEAHSLHSIRQGHRRRRPSGAPPPLPRGIGFTGTGWLVAAVLLTAWIIAAFVSRPVRRWTDQADAAILRTIARARTDWLTDVARWIDLKLSGWTITFLAISLIVALMVLRRWRHLFTFLGSVLVIEIFSAIVYDGFQRPRPYGVTIIGRWAGFTLPSAPVELVTVVAVAITYTLVVAGRPRGTAKVIGGLVVVVFTLSRLYLGVDHPFDVLVGIAVSVAVPLTAFRFFTPNDVFPVKYGTGKTAHLDVGGARGAAIRSAVSDQLGVTVLDVQPVGLAGSGGSTPLRIRVAGDPDTYLFGKIYAMNHVRADRWYKLGRTILYGRLEDEAPFQSVRRLVQFEDYTLRLFRDLGVRTAAPIGIVSLTPEREYMLVTEFLDGAIEISEATIDDALIDEGLALIRLLWDAGVAHRDIKPANLMVRDGHLFLIDVAFAQIRPSPWREAVDLANMMLVLAVGSDADRVYRRALTYFTPDEIAEAFAATRGIASPTQLRAVMKQDGRDLVAQFRELGPARRPISLQRWGFRRIALTLALVLAVWIVVPNVVNMLAPVHDLEIVGRPTCGTNTTMVLLAQSVPSATSVPCVAALPSGWTIGTVRIRNGRGRFWLDSDRAGDYAVAVTLLPRGRCSVERATEVQSDQVAMRRFEQPLRLPPNLRSVRTYLFDGGCITYRFAFAGDDVADLMFDAENAISFEPRERLVDRVRERSGLSLCGAGAPPCPGGS